MLSLITNLQFMAETESSSGLGALGINPIAILAQASTFLLLFFILKKFAFDGIAKSLEKRRAKVEDSIKEAEKLTVANKESEKRLQETIAEASKQSSKIIDDAKKEAAEIIGNSRVEAKTQTEAMVKSAEAEIKLSADRAKSELKSEMASLIAEATEKIIGEKMSSSQDRKIIEKALKG